MFNSVINGNLTLMSSSICIICSIILVSNSSNTCKYSNDYGKW